jgi:hypothetical protein
MAAAHAILLATTMVCERLVDVAAKRRQRARRGRHNRRGSRGDDRTTRHAGYCRRIFFVG